MLLEAAFKIYMIVTNINLKDKIHPMYNKYLKGYIYNTWINNLSNRNITQMVHLQEIF